MSKSTNREVVLTSHERMTDPILGSDKNFDQNSAQNRRRMVEIESLIEISCKVIKISEISSNFLKFSFFITL